MPWSQLQKKGQAFRALAHRLLAPLGMQLLPQLSQDRARGHGGHAIEVLERSLAPDEGFNRLDKLHFSAVQIGRAAGWLVGWLAEWLTGAFVCAFVCACLCLSVAVSLRRCVSPRLRVSMSRRPCSLCFCAVVRRCLRVALSLCFCVPRWSLFKFQPWSIGQGWKIKKGPFSNTHSLFNLLSLHRFCAPSVAGQPHHCAEPMPTIHSHAVFFSFSAMRNHVSTVLC